MLRRCFRFAFDVPAHICSTSPCGELQCWGCCSSVVLSACLLCEVDLPSAGNGTLLSAEDGDASDASSGGGGDHGDAGAGASGKCLRKPSYPSSQSIHACVRANVHACAWQVLKCVGAWLVEQQLVEASSPCITLGEE